jgi:hypothetical protein
MGTFVELVQRNSYCHTMHRMWLSIAVGAFCACTSLGLLTSPLAHVKSKRARQADFQRIATVTTSSRYRGQSTQLLAVGPDGAVDFGSGPGQFIFLAYIVVSIVAGANYVIKKIKNKEDLLTLK